MPDFRVVVVTATKLISGVHHPEPASAWNTAARRVFPSSASLREKGCPRGAFLGLCSAGLVAGVEPGNYAKGSKNGAYAIEAVEVLKRSKFLATQPDLLWRKVAGKTKTQNHRMDVVIGLWDAQLIDNRSGPDDMGK